MMEKGLFNSLFVIIMLLLVTPGLLISTNHQYIVNTSNHINNITYNVDQAVADALADVTISNTCAIANSSTYNTTINSYINNIVTDSSKNTSIYCSVVNESGSLVGSDFIGSVTINCKSKDDVSTMDITKKLEFSKNITNFLNPLFNTCSVSISDNYDLNNKQVNITR